MRMKSLTVAAMALAVALVASACSDKGTSNETGNDALNLSTRYGGYTAANESPAFGDSYLAEMSGSEPAFEDELFSGHALDSLKRGGRDVFALVLRWGQLEGDSSVTTMTDWSGSLELERGGIVVRRLLRFEAGQDHLVRPRTSRRILRWESTTSVHYDGLLLLVYVPSEDTASPPNSLALTMPQYSRTFSIDELDNFSALIDIDALGNQLSIEARAIEQIACATGPLDGIWRMHRGDDDDDGDDDEGDDDDDENDDEGGRALGRFAGRWMTDDGVFRGHVRGHFGILSDGTLPLFGKVIGIDGKFAGFLRGSWGFDDADSTQGWFSGAWDSREGRQEGTVEGTWVHSLSALDPADDDGDDNHPRRGGFFSGFWVRPCDGDSLN